MKAKRNEVGLGDTTLKEAILCTTAAPTYLPGEQLNDSIMIDGGTVNNNPTLSATIHAARNLGMGLNLTVCSLGTGIVPLKVDEATLKSGGLFGWLHPMINVMFMGQEELPIQLTEDLLGSDGRLHRVQFTIPPDLDALDNGTPANMHKLAAFAKQWFEDNADAFDALCADLAKRHGIELQPVPTDSQHAADRFRDHVIKHFGPEPASTSAPKSEASPGSSQGSGWSLQALIRWLTGGYTSQPDPSVTANRS